VKNGVLLKGGSRSPPKVTQKRGRKRRAKGSPQREEVSSADLFGICDFFLSLEKRALAEAGSRATVLVNAETDPVRAGIFLQPGERSRPSCRERLCGKREAIPGARLACRLVESINRLIGGRPTHPAVSPLDCN
jgi:hypothetical protein